MNDTDLDINQMLVEFISMTDDIESEMHKLANNEELMSKKYEQLMKLHKAITKAHKIALKAKSYFTYGDDYHDE